MKKIVETIKLFFTSIGKIFTSKKTSPDRPYGKISRFEVSDFTHRRRGRILIENKVNVEVVIQDFGKTMKIFLTDRK